MSFPADLWGPLRSLLRIVTFHPLKPSQMMWESAGAEGYRGISVWELCPISCSGCPCWEEIRSTLYPRLSASSKRKISKFSQGQSLRLDWRLLDLYMWGFTKREGFWQFHSNKKEERRKRKRSNPKSKLTLKARTKTKGEPKLREFL